MGGRRSSTYVRAYNRDAIAAVRAHLGQFSEEKLQRAADRAIASVGRKVQPEAKRDIRLRYGIRASALNNKFRAVQGKSRGGDPYVGVWASSRQIGLLEFQGRWRGRESAGAEAQIKLGNRKTYKHAFTARVQGKEAIRVRAFVSGSSGKRHGRGPMRMLRGPSPFEMLLGEDMRNGQVVASKLTTFFSSEIRRQIELLRKGK